MVQRWTLVDPQRPQRRLHARYVPRRALRPGAGAAAPAPQKGAPCALCGRDLLRIHHYREFGYSLDLAGPLRWIAYPNPYPAMPRHGVVVTDEHLPQDWIAAAPMASLATLRTIVAPMLDIAERLPGFVVGFNGIGAGATQWHRHLQVFERPSPGHVFPLEQAARDVAPAAQGALIHGTHPVTAMRFSGPATTVVDTTLAWVRGWLERHTSAAESLTANLIALADHSAGGCHLFFVPRARQGWRPAPFGGVPGCIEMLGELIVVDEAGRKLLDEGQLDHAAASQWLATVQTPGLP